MKRTLLIVDDEKHTRDGLKEAMSDHFEIYTAGNIKGALAALEADPADAVITDLKLGGENGMDLLEKILSRPNPPICIMMTAYGSVDTAVEAMRRGAYDFVTKPINIERLEMLVRRALREQATEKENAELKQEITKNHGLSQMIGTSSAMVSVFDTIRQVAPSKATVLIEGESGTGKEVAARAIHALSSRAKERFVAVHCAALSPQLLESELFGHEKGAFTGATERRIGRFEQASGGTLFLDEIGEIDPSVQVKILRILGERTFERVGGNQTLTTDVRLIAATNRNLEKMVSEGTFRDDLFFRLKVVPILMPPLRDRKEDIPLLVESFLVEIAKDHQKSYRPFSSEAMTLLLKYSWPGNVRELRTAVEHAIVLGRKEELQVLDLPLSIRKEMTATSWLAKGVPEIGLKNNDLFDTTQELLNEMDSSKKLGYVPSQELSGTVDGLNLEQVTSTLIERALQECNGNRSKAAEKLGISRRTLHRKLAALKR